ncbi:MAG: histidine phosphotransferase family protein [Pseudomonadota bacterium]
MNALPNLSAADLAALLCSRVCHDVIGPLGAVANGLEVLDEDNGNEMHDFAMELIRKSTGSASAKLKFCRIAYGAAGSAGASIDTGDAETVVRDLMEHEKPDVTWEGPRALVGKNRVKLLLNLVASGLHAIPRGGTIAVSLEAPESDNAVLTVTCTGKNARVPSLLLDFMNGTHEGDVDAHAIQSYYTVLLAKETGMTLAATVNAETVTLKATA